MRVPIAIYGVVLCVVCFVSVLSAQDAAKVDSSHYSVISENSQVRILKVHYGPHEKSVMHSHPNAVAVFLTDGEVKFTYPGGKSETVTEKSGDAKWTPATVHLPENPTDHAMDVILVELKGRAAKMSKGEMK